MTKTKRITAERAILAVLTVAFLAVIFLFSAQKGSESSATSSVFVDAFKRLMMPGFDDMSEAARDEINRTLTIAVRKLAHMLEYGVLSSLLLLNCRAWRITDRHLLRVGIALLASLLLAAGDELHQFLVPGRSGLITDVLIDGVGALLGLGVTTVVLYALEGARLKKAASAK